MKVWEIVKEENEGKLYLDCELGDIYKLIYFGVNLELINVENDKLITDSYVIGSLLEIEFAEVVEIIKDTNNVLSK